MGKDNQKPKTITQAELDVFEEAFRTSGTSQIVCECGKIFYNSNGGWDWEKNELEHLQADTEAEDVDYTIGRIEFEGGCYADGCTCWHERAARLYHWLIHYRYQICDFYEKVKDIRLKEAEAFPTVKPIQST